MDTSFLISKFEEVGARASIRPLVTNRWRPAPGPVVIDIGRDRRGEFFDIQASGSPTVSILDVQPKDRHLLLMVRQSATNLRDGDIKDKFLCGHDERHWFVAGIPEAAGVSNVITAKESLKPDLVKSIERGRKGKRKNKLRRKTDTFIRQGEWFFVPSPNIRVREKLVLRNEPISRGLGSKPHICEYLYRDGGTTVYVCRHFPDGLETEEYRKLLKKDPQAKKWNWRAMMRNPVVLVRGKVSHPDHATIRLDGWHRVAMNTEHQSRAMASIAFLD